jgi:[NiFe] hydrogenase diaphorase moiety large subunit
MGATQAILYLRGEYTYLTGSVEQAMKWLGQALAARGLPPFPIELHMGSGAYVCGEETALIESLEGRRGEARNRPPYPVVAGFHNHPTAVNNVETFCWVPAILFRGTDWFRDFGTAQSTGLKLFSVSGDCDHPGIYELPLGTTVQELLSLVGGQRAKAVQIGGAAGRCVPAVDFDSPLSYEGLSTGGSVIVFRPERDMLEVAENFLTFFCDESCGQCTPCRNGTAQLLEGIKRLQAGNCSSEELLRLCHLGATIQAASKCGLGQSSPNAFLSIVKSFRREILGGAWPRS